MGFKEISVICGHVCADLRSMPNGTSCSLILPPLVSRILFRCLIFDCYNISICKKGKVKDEASKENRETSGGQIKEQDIPNRYDKIHICTWKKLSRPNLFLKALVKTWLLYWQIFTYTYLKWMVNTFCANLLKRQIGMAKNSRSKGIFIVSILAPKALYCLDFTRFLIVVLNFWRKNLTGLSLDARLFEETENVAISLLSLTWRLTQQKQSKGCVVT